MHEISRSELVPFAPEQMFELVKDIESYPEFLPWCRAAKILRRTEQGVVATLSIAKGKLQHSFTTENRNAPSSQIEMRLVDGPFKQFHGFWRFEPVESGCKVALNLRFEFASRLVAIGLAPVFKAISGTMVEAFRDRAFSVYRQ